jgi:uncharacterized protein (TIGR00106 family)
MMMAEFAIFPIGRGESLSKYVARAAAIVQKSGLEYRLTPMGTIIEGDTGEVFEVIQRCQKALEKDCARISLAVKMDYRKGKTGRLEQKIRSVENKLEKTS